MSEIIAERACRITEIRRIATERHLDADIEVNSYLNRERYYAARSVAERHENELFNGRNSIYARYQPREATRAEFERVAREFAMEAESAIRAWSLAEGRNEERQIEIFRNRGRDTWGNIVWQSEWIESIWVGLYPEGNPFSSGAIPALYWIHGVTNEGINTVWLSFESHGEVPSDIIPESVVATRV